MGVGKSTVGTILSKKLKMKFIDIDSVIEGQENMTIEKIFQKKGEKLFREIEVKISLSQMTFSHQMIRLFFVEQLYRANTILKNEPYHHR